MLHTVEVPEIGEDHFRSMYVVYLASKILMETDRSEWRRGKLLRALRKNRRAWLVAREAFVLRHGEDAAVGVEAEVEAERALAKL